MWLLLKITQANYLIETDWLVNAMFLFYMKSVQW